MYMSGSFITIIYFRNDNGSIQDFACLESKYLMWKKRDNNLYEFIPFCFWLQSIFS